MGYRIPIDAQGTIYLLHFSARTRQGRQHYLGWSADVQRRLAQHRAGCGSHDTKKAIAEELQLTLAQTWRGTPRLETRLKEWSREGRKGFAGICPFCSVEPVMPPSLASELGPPSLKRYWIEPLGYGCPITG